MIAMRPIAVAFLVAAAAVVGACGEEETAENRPADEEQAIEAREDNDVELNGIQYRIAMFRQINPRQGRDQALYEGELPAGDVGIFAAFLRACNTSDARTTPTNDVTLEDAFGDGYPRLREVSDEAFDYDPRPLRPDSCLPSSDGGAETFPGAVLLFEVPVDRLRNRPFVLQLQDRNDGGEVETRRVELDL